MNQNAKHPDQRRLNVGCGAHYHKDWCNIDLVALGKEVISHDIRQGLPFADNSFDAVYHSHVLEHLNPEQGEKLIRECGRVLAPGGILRVVVPDLERITRLYLDMLDRAWVGNPEAEENYEWMKLELLDQMVRQKSGGLMGPYMIDSSRSNAAFVKSRIGGELDSCQSVSGQKPARLSKRISTWAKQNRQRLAMFSVRVLLGRDQDEAFRESLFRQQGEIHRWMYDRLSLKKLCETCGLDNFRVCQAEESSIEDFASFRLDSNGNQIRKPDSLFVECCKSKATTRMAA